jgi:BTB/POZ domain
MKINFNAVNFFLRSISVIPEIFEVLEPSFSVNTNLKFLCFGCLGALQNYTLGLTVDTNMKNLCRSPSFSPPIKIFRLSRVLIMQNLTDYGSCVFDVTVTVTFVKPPAKFSKFYDPAATSKNILNNFSNMLTDLKYSDFVFIVKGKEFKVHKNVLASASPVMDKMFSSEMEESRNQKCIIETIQPEIFDSFLHFVYHGKLPVNFTEVAKDLYEAAHYYQIDLLSEICKKEVQSQLAKENALELFHWSYTYDLEELKIRAWQIIKR